MLAYACVCADWSGLFAYDRVCLCMVVCFVSVCIRFRIVCVCLRMFCLVVYACALVRVCVYACVCLRMLAYVLIGRVCSCMCAYACVCLCVWLRVFVCVCV